MIVSTKLIRLITVFSISIVFVFIGLPTAFSADEKNEVDSVELIKLLDSVERELNRSQPRLVELDSAMQKLPDIKNWAQLCVQSEEKKIDELTETLKSVGEPIDGELPDVVKKRQSINEEKISTEKRLAYCRVILLRSEESTAAINKLKQAVLSEQMLAKGASFSELLRGNWEHPAKWIEVTKVFILENSGLDKVSGLLLILFLFVFVIMLGIGLWIRARLKRWVEYHAIRERRSSRLLHAWGLTLILYAPYLLTSVGVALLIFATARDIHPIPFIAIVAYGLPLVFLLMSLVHVFLCFFVKLQSISTDLEATAKKLTRRLKVLVILLFLGYLLFSTILAQSLPLPSLQLTRAIYGVALIINLVWIVWLTGQLHKTGRNYLFRFILSILLIGALAVEWAGYRNLAVYILRITVITPVGIGLIVLLNNLLRDVFDGIDKGESAWQRRLRTTVGVKPGQPLPGVVWFRFIMSLSVWSVLIMFLVIVWQVPDAYVQTILGYITDGFSLGSFDVKPVLFLQGVVTLAILLTINSWFRKRLDQGWLVKTRMERGARESMVTITGYVGMGIAILIALSVAGMDFSKLAIIAGALSLGIGFGLQNIVNNFISGLILLFERPIKTGDWVIVGNVEGYVQKISIRSTQIQTFDLADVIVPNAEFISGNVTNLMLYNTRGRIRVPIGVAYGSDTEKVKQILLDIANNNKNVIRGGLITPEPSVIFKSFGDSALDFELRCHINNIDQRLSVVSELNFEIDRLFRQNGVEIPFPQRDIHIRQEVSKVLPGISDPADGEITEK